MNVIKNFSEGMLEIYKNPEIISEEDKTIAIALGCMITRVYVRFDLYDFQDLKENVYRFLKTLTETEYIVITRIYGLDGEKPQTFVEIATELQKSAMRINQIEIDVLKKFKHWNKQMGYKQAQNINLPSCKIEELNLSDRPHMALKRNGIRTIEKLSKLTQSDLRNIRNIGEKSIAEIISKLSEIGIILED